MFHKVIHSTAGLTKGVGKYIASIQSKTASIGSDVLRLILSSFDPNVEF